MENHPNFPVLRSILASSALTALVEAAYGLRVMRLQLIKAVTLDTYRVGTEQGPYILRIYPAHRRTLDAINAELDLLLYLHTHGAPVSVPILLRTGERLLTLSAPEGTRYAALFTYAPGEPLGENLAAIRTYGHTLACVHALTDGLPPTLARPRLDLTFLLDRPLEHLVAIEHRHEWLFLQQVAAVIREQVETLPTTAPAYGYCHGDADSGNAHVAADGGVTLFDFDCCGLGWRVYDLATFLSGASGEAAAAFLQGYQTVRLLTLAEQNALPYWQMAQSIWMLGTRASYINEWGEIHFTESFINRMLKQIRTIFATVEAC